jgi:hypothetical protein
VASALVAAALVAVVVEEVEGVPVVEPVVLELTPVFTTVLLIKSSLLISFLSCDNTGKLLDFSEFLVVVFFTV